MTTCAKVDRLARRSSRCPRNEGKQWFSGDRAAATLRQLVWKRTLLCAYDHAFGIPTVFAGTSPRIAVNDACRNSRACVTARYVT